MYKIIFSPLLAIAMTASASSPSTYQDMKDAGGLDNPLVVNFVDGVLTGATNLNVYYLSMGKEPIYCQTKGLALTPDNLWHFATLIVKEDPSVATEHSFGNLAIFSLMRTFPCQ